MRVTAVCLRQHIGQMFKYKWHLMSQRKAACDGAAAVLEAKGVEIVDPKELLSPTFRKRLDHLELPPREVEEDHENLQTPRYVFKDSFSPPGGLTQVQNLTNTIVHPMLPESVLSRVEASTDEENANVRDAILLSHLLDSHQEKLVKDIDVHNHPGWNFPRTYGSPVWRKNKSLTYQLNLLLDKLHASPDQRIPISNTKVQVNLNHSDILFQAKLVTHFMVASTVPLPPVASETEIVATENEPLPDIYPLSPFLHCQQTPKYTEDNFSNLSTSALFPRTLFIHKNFLMPRFTNDTFTGATLLKVFSHAAAHAKQWCSMEDGVLKDPLTLQVIHISGRRFHFGIFQLNTLDLCGPKKNIFWQHPIELLYKSCGFEGAEPTLVGYNPKIFNLLKAFHVQ